jgi:hypothetical protein
MNLKIRVINFWDSAISFWKYATPTWTMARFVRSHFSVVMGKCLNMCTGKDRGC